MKLGRPKGTRELNDDQVSVMKGSDAEDRKFVTYSPFFNKTKEVLVFDDGENIVVKKIGMFDSRKSYKVKRIGDAFFFKKNSMIPYGRYQINTEQSTNELIVIPYNKTI